MAEEREGPTRGDEKRKQEEERRRKEERARRKRGRDREKPTAAVAIVKKADELLEGVKESELPEPEKKSFEEKLKDVKEKAETRERKKNPVEELMQVIELFLELGKIEDEIVDTKKQEIWKKLQQETRGIQKSVKEGKLTKKDVDYRAGQLLDEIRDKEEDVSDEEIQKLIGRAVGGIRTRTEGVAVDEENLDLMEEIGGKKFTPEKRRQVQEDLLRLRGREGEERPFKKEEKELLDKYPHWTDEEAEKAREMVEAKVNRIFEVVDTNVGADFHTAMTIYDQHDLSVIHRKLLDMGDWGKTLSQKLMGENNLRRHLFTLNYGIERGGFKPDKLAEHMFGFTNELRGVLVNIEGASTAARLWEMGFEKLLMHYDYVPYERVAYDHTGRSELGDWVKTRFKDHLKNKYTDEEIKKIWPDWKINRAISVGKGNGLVTLSLVAIAAKGKLPLEAQGMYSPWGEDFVRTINVNYHLYSKFLQGYPAQAIFQYFLLTGEKPPPGLSTKELLRLIKEKAGRAKELGEGKKRLIDKVNLVGAGGPWTRSSWRAMLAAGHIEGKSAKALQHLGTNLSLILLKERLGEDKKAEWEKEVREIWTKALDRDALQIVREAEILNDHLEQLLKQILPNLKDKERQVYFNQIKEFPPDERMKHLVLLDFLKQRGPENWKTKWQELTYYKSDRLYEPDKPYKPDTLRWQRMKILKRKDEFLDQIENQYLLVREAMVSQIERTGIDVEFKIEQLSDEVQAYLRSIDKIANLKFGPKDTDTIFESLVERTLKDDFPLGLSAGDTAWKLLEFGAEGQQALHRRYRDFAAASEAVGILVGMLWRFPEYQKNPLKFVEDAKALHTKITDYDPNTATDVCENLLEGFIRASDGDLGVKFLPFPLDRLYDMFVRSSYAEKVLGEGALSLTAVDERNLIKHFREMGMLATLDDMTGEEKEEKLLKKLGATWPRVAFEFLIKYGPFGILFIFWQIWKEYEEKTSQAFK